MPRTLSKLAQVCEGQLHGPDGRYETVCTDTRTLTSGALFVALKGPNFDGHLFLDEALDKGAVGALVSRAQEQDIAQVTVDDTKKALGRLAGSWREGFDLPVVAVTGSNGKTTTRTLISGILAQRFNVHATKGNFNNEIGLPLTLLELTARHDAMVVELGANHPGEIAYLSDLAKPTVGLVTNAGPAHLEGFGSLQGVANAKGELFQALPTDGVAIINADDPFADVWRDMATCTQVEFGFDPNAHCRLIGDVEVTPTGQRFSISLAGHGETDIELPLSGLHNIRNALAATAAAVSAGATLDDVAAGLRVAAPVQGRLRQTPGLNGSRIIDDSYNANPASVRAAIDMLASQPGTRMLVLGDMAELGQTAASLHEDIGRYARETGIDQVVTVGDLSSRASVAFGDPHCHFSDLDAACEYLKECLGPDLVVLIKGSRSMGLELLVRRLQDRGDADAD